MLLENLLKEYRPTVRISSNIYNGYGISFHTGQLVSFFISYLPTVTVILLLTGTTGIFGSLWSS